MEYGICNLGIVPLRAEPSDKSELSSQILYGECFKVLEKRKDWIRVRLADDDYEGWIDKKQFLDISEEDYSGLVRENPSLVPDLIEFVSDTKKTLTPIFLGSNLNGLQLIGHEYEGRCIQGKKPKSELVQTAFLYLNAPYLWGGKTPFGIDCSGFTQMVYKLNGHKLLRDASLQAQQGEVLSFIEESEPGDLAFFDNAEGQIIHVGIIMNDNYIIHAHGKVRLDRLDHTGIFNVDSERYSHQLRVIKKIVE